MNNTYHTKREIELLRVRNSFYGSTGLFGPLILSALTGVFNVLAFAVGAWLFFAVFFGV